MVEECHGLLSILLELCSVARGLSYLRGLLEKLPHGHVGLDRFGIELGCGDKGLVGFVPLLVAGGGLLKQRRAQPLMGGRAFGVELEQFAQAAVVGPQPVPPELTDLVSAAVEGPVLAARLVDGGLWVVGGAEANHYHMDLIAAVFDAGGADAYTFPARAPGAYQLVIDASGDDRYESSADLAGPAAAVFSVAILIDRSGQDRYISHRQGAIAASLFGVAILIDESGDVQHVLPVAAGAAIPGTVWIKVDSDTLMTQGGLVYEFGADSAPWVDSIHWIGHDYPRFDFTQITDPSNPRSSATRATRSASSAARSTAPSPC